MRPNVLIAVFVTFAACALSHGQAGTSGSPPAGATSAGTTGAASGGAPTGGSPVPTETATITFDDGAPREVWIQAGPCTGPTPDSIKPSGSAVELPLTGKDATDNIYIWDHKAGNMAETTVGALRKALNMVLPAKAFGNVAEVKIRLEHMGQPVSTAIVTVEDPKKPRVQLLDPTTRGELTFYDMAPGSLKVTAAFKATNGTQKSVTQLVDAPLGHGDPSAVGVLSIADDVATVSPAAAAATGATGGTTQITPPDTAGAGSPATGSATTGSPGAGSTATGATGTGSSGTQTTAGNSQNPGNSAGSAFAYLLGLVVMAGIVYAAWRYAKANPDMVQSKLHQLGVDVPKPGDDPRQFDPAAAPAPAQPQPLQKIILADSAPEPLTPYSASNVVAATGEPKLRSESGDAMALPTGETVVGRDAGLGLSLVGESTVSRRHAQLVRNGGDVTVTDLGSTNGTYVNGMALSGPQTLRPGDTVQFGAIRFRFEG